VLGGHAHAAPPEHGAILDEIVEPRLTDLRGGQCQPHTLVRHSPQERKGARDVIVNHDERLVQLPIHIVTHLSQLPHDPLVRPALERSPHIHADDLAKNAGVDALKVIGR